MFKGNREKGSLQNNEIIEIMMIASRLVFNTRIQRWGDNATVSRSLLVFVRRKVF